MKKDVFDLEVMDLWGGEPRVEDWQIAPCGESHAIERGVDAVMLEIKSAEALSEGEDLGEILRDLTAELKAQMIAFSAIRRSAQAVLGDTSADESAQKQAKADMKAATDAVALIARTLDKVDDLSRRMRDDVAKDAGNALDETEMEALRQYFEQLIADKAEARARELVLDGAGDGKTGADPGG